jgi:hypothetical protein
MTDAASSLELPVAPRSLSENPPRVPPHPFSEVLAQASASSGDAKESAPGPPSGSLDESPPPITPDGAGQFEAWVGSSPFGLLPPSVSVPPSPPVMEVVLAAQAAGARRGSTDLTGEAKRGLRGDPLDPATRQSAQLAPPFSESGGVQAPAALAPPILAPPMELRARASLEEVLPAVVRRIAWSGDGRKGSLRLEFGAGALAGGTLVVHADDGRIRVELSAPPGADTSAWKERIVSRLQERKLHVDEVVVE